MCFVETVVVCRNRCVFRGSLLVICNIVRHRPAMRVNVWLCAPAIDPDLEGVLSKGINLRLPKTVNCVLCVACELCVSVCMQGVVCSCVVCTVRVSRNVCVCVCLWCWLRVHGAVVFSGKANE